MEDLLSRQANEIKCSENNIPNFYNVNGSDENLYFDEPFESDCDDQSLEQKTKQLIHATHLQKKATKTCNKPANTRYTNKRTKPHGFEARNRKAIGVGINRRDCNQPINASAPAYDLLEANQFLLAELRSENEEIKRELKATKIELKTIERQYKVQEVRLTKAIGREADMPMLIDRLNAEVRSLQVQLRRKTDQTETAERRATEMEQKLLPLIEQHDREGKQNQTSSLNGNTAVNTKRYLQTIDNQKRALEKEQKINHDLTRKLELLERTQKFEQNSSNDHIRRLRRLVSELQKKLTDVTRHLQEKSKLLELQNMYSHRLPKSVCTVPALSNHDKLANNPVPGIDALHRTRAEAKLSLSELSARNQEMSISSERLDKEFDQLYNRRYNDIKQDLDADVALANLENFRPTDVQGLLDEAADALSSINIRKGEWKRKSTKLSSRSSSCDAKLKQTENMSMPSRQPVVNTSRKRHSNKNNASIEIQKQPIPLSRKSKNYNYSPKKIDKSNSSHLHSKNASLNQEVHSLNSSCNSGSSEGIDRDNSKIIESPADSEHGSKSGLSKCGKHWKVINECGVDKPSEQGASLKRESLEITNKRDVAFDVKMEGLQAELSRITERHENFKTESANKYSSNIVDPFSRSIPQSKVDTSFKKRKPTVLTECDSGGNFGLMHDSETKRVQGMDHLMENDEISSEPDRFELCKEERLWKDLFGKEDGDLSGVLTPKPYIPSSHLPKSNKTLSNCKASSKQIPGVLLPKSSTLRKSDMSMIIDSTIDEKTKKASQTLGKQLENSVRRQSVARNPFDDLGIEDVPI